MQTSERKVFSYYNLFGTTHSSGRAKKKRKNNSFAHDLECHVPEATISQECSRASLTEGRSEKGTDSGQQEMLDEV